MLSFPTVCFTGRELCSRLSFMRCYTNGQIIVLPSNSNYRGQCKSYFPCLSFPVIGSPHSVNSTLMEPRFGPWYEFCLSCQVTLKWLFWMFGLLLASTGKKKQQQECLISRLGMSVSVHFANRTWQEPQWVRLSSFSAGLCARQRGSEWSSTPDRLTEPEVPNSHPSIPSYVMQGSSCP